MRKRVFVAGKYNDTNVTNVLANMRKGINASIEVLKAGMAPYCPWLDFQWGLAEELSAGEYKDVAMAWLSVCDAVVVLPGWETSEGTKAEIDCARELNIPIYYSVAALVDDPKMRNIQVKEKISGTIKAILSIAKELRQKMDILCQARNVMPFFLTTSFIDEAIFGFCGIIKRMEWLVEENLEGVEDLKNIMESLKSDTMNLKDNIRFDRYRAAGAVLMEAVKKMTFIIDSLEKMQPK
jgi:hypothetical protein